MDNTSIVRRVAQGLDLLSAVESGGQAGSLTLVQELEREAATRLLFIEDFIDGMARPRRLYLATGMKAAIDDPTIPVVGTFSRARWLEVQEAFDEFEKWLNTPLPDCGVPPLVIVSRRGNPQEPTE